MKCYHYIIFCLCMLVMHTAGAQINYNGKKFFVGLGGTGWGFALGTKTTIQLASTHHASVTFHYSASGAISTYTLVPDMPLDIALTPTEINNLSNTGLMETINNHSLEITADSNIIVTVLSGSSSVVSDDALIVLPVDNQFLGDTYYLLGINSGDSSSGTGYSYIIVSSADNTIVQITPPVNTAYHAAGIPFTITLNKGETYPISNPINTGTMPITNNDITGTYIKVLNASLCNQLSVYLSFPALNIGWPAATWHQTNGSADNILEQMLPVTYWDTVYPVVAFAYDTFSILRILSSADNDTIFYNGSPVHVLDHGEFFDTLIAPAVPSIIRSKYPTGIAQFMVGCQADTSYTGGDPDMLWVPSLKNGTKESWFRVLLHPIVPRRYMLVAVSKASNVSSITLNGVSLASYFSPFPADPAMAYAIVLLDTDTVYHFLSADKVSAYITEENAAGSYSHILSDITSLYPVPHAADSSTTWDTTLCSAAGSIILSGPGGGSYTHYDWSTGDTTHNITINTSGTYLVTASGCINSITDTFHVTYIPTPTVALGNDTALCTGDTLLLTSVQPPGDTVLWSTGATGSTITVNSTGIYWISVKNGCSNADTIHVTVNPPPVVDLGPDITECSAAPVVLHSLLTYPAATGYVWNDGHITQADTVNISGSYWLRVTVNGCSRADTISVQILGDTLILYSPDTAICKGQSVQVSAYASSSATFQWLPTAGVPLSTLLQPLITPDTSATYIVKVSLNPCPDIVDSFHIDVQPVPDIYLTDRIVCEYDTLHIPALVSPAWYTHYIYNWSPGGLLDDSEARVAVFHASGEHNRLILNVSTPAGCHATDSANITIHPGDFANLDTNFALCPHDSVQLQPEGGVSYQWHPALYLSDSLAAAPWAHPITSQVYMGVATSAYGCRDTVHVNITVYPAAVITLADSAILYPGQSYHIDLESNCTSFHWSPRVGLDNIYIADPIATPDVSTQYRVIGITEHNCKAIDFISIIIDPNTILALPNAFAPGSGPLKIIRRGDAALHYFRIFNRWGNLVFSASDINEGWDGTYKGVPQPFDVYVYEIEAIAGNGMLFTKSGNVTLIR